MRETAKNVLPDSILNQPKRSIVDPKRQWMQAQLHDWIMDIFSSKVLRKEVFLISKMF